MASTSRDVSAMEHELSRGENANSDDNSLLDLSLLSKKELVAMKQSIPRFAAQVDAVFKKKYIPVPYVLFLGDASDDDDDNFLDESQIFELFGHCIQSVQVERSDIYRLINLKEHLGSMSYCSNLQHLTLHNLNTDFVCPIIRKAAILKNLESLIFIDCYYAHPTPVKDLLSCCDPLKLKTFHWYDATKQEFSVQFTDMSDVLMEYIGEHMVNIEDMRIDVHHDYPWNGVTPTEVLQNLKKLKRLLMTCKSDLPVVQIINDLAKIDSLEEFGLIDEDGTTSKTALIGAINNLENVERFAYTSRQIQFGVGEIVGFKKIDVLRRGHIYTSTFER